MSAEFIVVCESENPVNYTKATLVQEQYLGFYREISTGRYLDIKEIAERLNSGVVSDV